VNEWVEQLRVAAIRFLNPAPLMWDFEHEPWRSQMAQRYRLEWMMPSECAARLALPEETAEAADLGLVPIAALATNPELRLVPGCAIAATRRVRSLLLIRRAQQPLSAIRTVAADTSSRATLAYTQILFREWWQPGAGPEFRPHGPDVDAMLDSADAALVIGDPALYALEERQNREERSGEELIYHDLAAEWIALTGLPWVSAVWAVRKSVVERGGSSE
jgi:chorismate dehydratase